MSTIKTNRGERLINDNTNLTKEQKEVQDKVLKNQGPNSINGAPGIYPVPEFNLTAGEKVICHNNSWIVLGKDRDASSKSGFGGQGSKDAFMIDLVAGRASSYTQPGSKPHGSPSSDIRVNPNFFSDAARVYISQKADIDKYLALAPVVGERSEGRSAVALKADCIRIVGTNDIKIVTGKAAAQGGDKGEPNSGGGSVDGAGTICLIAGNYTEGHSLTKMPFLAKVRQQVGIKDEEFVETIQGIPKGDNLAECLEEIVTMIEELASIVMENSNGIRELSGATGTHFHDYGGGFGPTTPSSIVGAKLIPSYIKALKFLLENLNCSYNGAVIRLNYLRDYSPKYIKSRHVFTS